MGKKIYWLGNYDSNKKILYEELTYDFFSEHIDYEYCFSYKDKIISIANCFDKINKKQIYHISINDKNDLQCKNGQHQYFNSPKELLEKGRIDGKTLREIWDDLED